MKGFIKDEIPSRWDENKMTHYELLAEIDIQLLHLPSYFKAGDKTIAGMKALRAVVALHKPNQDNECVQCIRQYYMDDIRNVDYPCDTIQIIEKELG